MSRKCAQHVALCSVSFGLCAVGDSAIEKIKVSRSLVHGVRLLAAWFMSSSSWVVLVRVQSVIGLSASLRP